jgi:NADH dehydrogenase FAD-containing subunit
LAAPLARKRVTFVHKTALRIDPAEKLVVTDRGEYRYGLLVVATGYHSPYAAAGASRAEG